MLNAEGEDAAQHEGGHRNEPDEARRRRRSCQKTNVPIAPKLHTRLHRRRAEHERGGNRKRGMLNLSAVIVCRTQVDTCCCRRLHRISSEMRHIFYTLLLASASALPLASASSQSTKGAKSGGRLGGKRDHPLCRDTEAGCTHAAKVKARAKKAAKLPAAEQAEAKRSTNASAVHRLLKGGQWAEAAACWRTDWATVCPQQAQLPPMPPTSCPRLRPNELHAEPVMHRGSCAGPC